MSERNGAAPGSGTSGQQVWALRKRDSWCSGFRVLDLGFSFPYSPRENYPPSPPPPPAPPRCPKLGPQQGSSKGCFLGLILGKGQIDLNPVALNLESCWGSIRPQKVAHGPSYKLNAFTGFVEVGRFRVSGLGASSGFLNPKP